MPGTVRIALGVGVAVVLAAALAACGSSKTTTSGAATANSNPANANNGAGGKRGGILKVVTNEDAQHLDPGLAYFTIDYEYTYATQRPLFSYKPNDQTNPVADLAAGPPQISADNKTVTVHIRPGVHFSPPVNREVTTADVAYAIERGFNPHVANPYIGVYYGNVVGADKANGGPLAGIKTPDKYTIVFSLTKPTGGLLAAAFVLPVSAPVPKEYAQKFDAHTPSDYGNYQVATGPYKLQSDASGKVIGIGYQPGKHITLVRNPNWSAATDYRPAYLDGVDWSIGVPPEIAGRQALTGTHIVDGDTPTATIVKLAYQRYRSQIFFSPGSGNRYVALNTQVPPFNNVNLRKAVFAAMNRKQMGTVRGGLLVATPATHFIYPGLSGFEEAGGIAGPGYDFTTSPTGNMAVATAYMKKAGYPSGRYTGAKPLVVVGSTGAPADQDAQIVNQTLQNLGFQTNLKLVDQSVMYGTFCGTPKLKVNVCPNVAWGRDFADPQTVLAPTFEGSAITQTNNQNWPQLNDPAINAAMEKAKLLNGTAARAQAWGKIDDMVTATAAAVPWSWDNQANVYSKDTMCVNALYNTGPCDFSFSSLK
ncbi:MAG: peptide/nickel transport system substrate-binding protein [Solirubrobacteraceae bacterium]|jgi:peptide/nickel transport system substrate-binding protein|nr:peptide/nickel transport system substrate-binding protein [Solirubrobacteraceae bacterium]